MNKEQLTHRNEAKYGEIAKTVIMPGDPLRAKFIAETYLEDYELVNSVRNMYAYTGTYKGKRISVMAHGIGATSMAVYSHELFNLYDVDNILRVGTSGAVSEDLNLNDVVISLGASYDTSYVEQYQLPGKYSAVASYPLLAVAVDRANELGVDYRVGDVISTDVLYPDDWEEIYKPWEKMGILALDCEVAALYIVAARSRKKALGLLTVSSDRHGKDATIEERVNSLTNMINIALETAYSITE